MLALTIRCEIPAAREPTTPASTSGPVTLGSKATAPTTTLVFASIWPAIEPSTPRWRTSPTSPNERSARKPFVGLETSNSGADEGQRRRDGVSDAQLELLGLDRRQHFVAIDRRRRRDAGLLETGHPAAEHSGAVRETDNRRSVVERGIAAALGSRAGDGQHVLVVARLVHGEAQLNTVAPGKSVARRGRDLLDRVLASRP